MTIARYDWAATAESEQRRLLKRSEASIEAVLEDCRQIIEAVKADGDEAVCQFTARFDFAESQPETLWVSPAEFSQAEAALPQTVKTAIDYAIDNVRHYHQQQIPQDQSVQIRPGLVATERWRPIDSVGLYVPRGRGSFPSMLYMLAIPARLAGVPNIVVCSPPDRHGQVDPACLYAAWRCGLDRVLRCGGAQAVAALAWGTSLIPKVDKVIGPGSRYVAAAKRLLADQIDTGLPAGPSEAIILADGSADPRLVALDLLIEAEHGADSQALLITDSTQLADAVTKELEARIAAIPAERRSFVQTVFKEYGGIVITTDLVVACQVVNRFAPEHLQIQAANARQLVDLIRHAGEILIGPWTPFSVANYATGPNAVLPTGGHARTRSAVSVRDFLRSSSIIECDVNAYNELKPHVIALADYEGFYTHAQALRDRVL